MAGQFDAHDCWRLDTSAVFSVSSAAVQSSQVFGTQTRAVQISFAGAFGSNSYIQVRIGPAPVVNSTTDTILQPNWPQIYRVHPGEQISMQSHDIVYSVSVTELTN